VSAPHRLHWQDWDQDLNTPLRPYEATLLMSLRYMVFSRTSSSHQTLHLRIDWVRGLCDEPRLVQHRSAMRLAHWSRCILRNRFRNLGSARKPSNAGSTLAKSILLLCFAYPASNSSIASSYLPSRA